MTKTKKRAWLGDRDRCDICNRDISPDKVEYFVDGKTKLGPWALMCPDCFFTQGVGTGLGRGQQYSGDKSAILMDVG